MSRVVSKMVATKPLLAGARWSQRLAIWAAAKLNSSKEFGVPAGPSRSGPGFFGVRAEFRPAAPDRASVRPERRGSRRRRRRRRAAPWTWKSGAPALELWRAEAVSFEPKSRCSPVAEPAIGTGAVLLFGQIRKHQEIPKLPIQNIRHHK